MTRITKAEQELKDYLMACRNDFALFAYEAFKIVYPNKEFLPNWHIEVLAEQLTRSFNKQCPRLIINMPPRMLKSFITSVAYPAWVLGRNPSAQIMCISYGDELVKDLGTLSQTLMQSDRYKKIFPHVHLSKRRNSYNHIQLNRTGGCRMGIAAGGAITGRGADIIIIDDPLKASDAKTKERETINQWFDDNIYQRLNNKNDGAIILVMQRLHQFDLSGHLLEKPEKWLHLKLPAIADEDQSFELPSGNVYVRKEGEILHPKLESLEKLNMVKLNQGGYVFSAQYQQEPASDKEAIIQTNWFRIVPRSQIPRQYYRIVQSWDTAHKIEEHNDYSVGITIARYGDNYYITDVIRKRMSFSELMDTMERAKMQNYELELLVEDAASGQTIIQQLRNKGIAVKAHKPLGDKYTRLNSVSGLIQSGFVYLPADAPWLHEFVKEITRFPNTKHDDQVDALSQGLQFLNVPIPRISSMFYIR